MCSLHAWAPTRRGDGRHGRRARPPRRLRDRARPARRPRPGRNRRGIGRDRHGLELQPPRLAARRCADCRRGRRAARRARGVGAAGGVRPRLRRRPPEPPVRARPRTRLPGWARPARRPAAGRRRRAGRAGRPNWRTGRDRVAGSVAARVPQPVRPAGDDRHAQPRRVATGDVERRGGVLVVGWAVSGALDARTRELLGDGRPGRPGARAGRAPRPRARGAAAPGGVHQRDLARAPDADHDDPRLLAAPPPAARGGGPPPTSSPRTSRRRPTGCSGSSRTSSSSAGSSGATS